MNLLNDGLCHDALNKKQQRRFLSAYGSKEKHGGETDHKNGFLDFWGEKKSKQNQKNQVVRGRFNKQRVCSIAKGEEGQDRGLRASKGTSILPEKKSCVSKGKKEK